MISYVTVGADDMAQAEHFWSAILRPLGYDLDVSEEGLSYALPCPTDGQGGPSDLYVKPPYDGQPASVGNGTMVAFQVPTQAQVRALHAAAMAAGGRDEGPPGFRDAYSAGFYVSYLRDPQGNKVALFCNHPDEPRRPS